MRNALITILILVLAASAAPAQTTRPALAQLDAEMRALYADVASGTVRVQLPMSAVARLSGPDANWLNKWGDLLDPRLLRQLEQLPATQPAGPGVGGAGSNGRRVPGRELDAANVAPGGSKTVLYLDEMTDKMIAVLPRDGAAAGEFVGVVLEGGAHVAIPAHVTREELGSAPLRVTAGHEQVEATFVGSDRQTNVTVLRLAKPFGKPLPVADAKPELGSLVVMLLPSRRVAKLALWTGGHEDHAVVIDVAGRLAGFARPGQLLAGADLAFVAGEIVRHGKVKRAQLGVWIGQVPPNDPIRQQVAALGARPALRVAKVMNDSAAVAAGLKKGDLILSLAGEPVEDLPTFAAAISSHAGPTELKVIRDGKEMTITANLEPK